MPSLTYPQCIRRLYESEANGELIYGALLRVAKSERERYHLGTLLQLETETKAWLQPFLFKHRVELSSPDIRPFVDQAVSLYASHGWRALMHAAQTVVAQAIADFEAIAAVSPISDSAYTRGMVEHERAIEAWVASEVQGPQEGSLEPIVALLRHRLPAP